MEAAVLTGVGVVLAGVLAVVLASVVAVPIFAIAVAVVAGLPISEDRGLLMVLVLPGRKILAISICEAASYRATVDAFFGVSLALHST